MAKPTMPIGGGGLDFRVGSSNSQLTSAATSLRPFSRTIAVFQPEAPSALMTSPQNRRDNSRKYLADRLFSARRSAELGLSVLFCRSEPPLARTSNRLAPCHSRCSCLNRAAVPLSRVPP